MYLRKPPPRLQGSKTNLVSSLDTLPSHCGALGFDVRFFCNVLTAAQVPLLIGITVFVESD